MADGADVVRHWFEAGSRVAKTRSGSSQRSKRKSSYLHKYTYNADKQCVAQLYIDLINTIYSTS